MLWIARLLGQTHALDGVTAEHLGATHDSSPADGQIVIADCGESASSNEIPINLPPGCSSEGLMQQTMQPQRPSSPGEALYAAGPRDRCGNITFRREIRRGSESPCLLCVAVYLIAVRHAIASRSAALLGRFLPRLGPLATASGPFSLRLRQSDNGPSPSGTGSRLGARSTRRHDAHSTRLSDREPHLRSGRQANPGRSTEGALVSMRAALSPTASSIADDAPTVVPGFGRPPSHDEVSSTCSH
jgi:hypothetical protein